MLIWFTGLSGSGKSTLANELSSRLFKSGIATYILDGDNVRNGLNGDLGFSLEDRSDHIRRVAEVSKLFIDAGIVTIGAFISPLLKDRTLVKETVGSGNFLEVFVNTPLEVCESRDPKGLYLKARAGEIANFTGISSPYESPKNPDFTIDTGDQSYPKTMDLLLEEVMKRLKR